MKTQAEAKSSEEPRAEFDIWAWAYRAARLMSRRDISIDELRLKAMELKAQLSEQDRKRYELEMWSLRKRHHD